MKDELESDLVFRALRGAVVNKSSRSALLHRIGVGLIRRHLRPRHALRWDDQPMVYEEADAASITFHQPREYASIEFFLEAVLDGAVVDA